MQDRQLTVMQLIRNLDIGGAQEVVRTLVAYLAEAGCAPVVCSFKDGPLRPEIERLGIPVVILPDRRYSVVALRRFVSEMLRIRRTLADLAQTYQVDVVQTHLLQVLDFLVLTLRRGDLRVFWTIHNYNFMLRADQLQRHRWLLGPKRFGYRLLYRLAARWVDGFIAVSDEVRTALLEQIGAIDDKIAVICNGVDIRRYGGGGDRAGLRRRLGLPEDAHLMALVGTLKPQKGHRVAIEAARTVAPRFPRLHLLFVGDGAERAALESLAASSGVGEHIHFLGSRGDVPELLASCDSFVLPSLWEGLPMALIEAMASGLPVVASEVSGTKQVMLPGETGLLVPPGDATALAAAMTALLADPVAAVAMGAAGRRRVETAFSAQRQAEDHLALYRWALHGGRGALHLGARP
ncbi:MAG TPA: glycosyltransferase [Roseiflexaceae bacterium]|nr:glycosyltransferase [Roseiflexaceae bacterium]